jgi:hypothetical protein
MADAEHPDPEQLVTFTMEFDHGLLVIEGLGSRAKHEAWDPSNEFVHVDGDSLYMCVMPPEEAPLPVAVFDGRAGLRPRSSSGGRL